MFVEQNIRGGLSYINQRYCRRDGVKVENGASFSEMLYIDGSITY